MPTRALDDEGIDFQAAAWWQHRGLREARTVYQQAITTPILYLKILAALCDDCVQARDVLILKDQVIFRRAANGDTRLRKNRLVYKH